MANQDTLRASRKVAGWGGPFVDTGAMGRYTEDVAFETTTRSQKINSVERQFEREYRKLKDNQLSKLNEVGVKRELRHIELEKVRHKIRKSEKEGVSAIAEVVNLAFKGKR